MDTFQTKMIDAQANAIDYKPHFEWRKYWQGFQVLALDAAWLALFCILGFIFIRYVVLAGSIEGRRLNGQEVEAIIGHVAWPFALFMTAFLFRNPLLMLLHEAQGLIWRSYYRHGEEDVPPIADYKNDVGNEVASPATPLEDGGNESPGNPLRLIDNGNGEEMEIKVLGWFRKTYDAPVLVSKGLGDSRYIFDGIMQSGNRLYGIEVKRTSAISNWKRVMANIYKVYTGLSAEWQGRFVFVAAVVGEKTDLQKNRRQLERFALEQPFKAEFAFFTCENGTVEVMP